MNIYFKPIIFSAAAGAILTLASCVQPYGPPVATTTSVKSYSPGYSVRSLPNNYRSERIGGANYYYHNGAYYQRRSNDYVVVSAPRKSRYYNEYTNYRRTPARTVSTTSERRITRLPRGYETVQYRGEPYYRSQNNYYRRQGSGYITVANPF